MCKIRGNKRKYSHQSHVQIQRCVIWKVPSLDEIRYHDKLEEEHEENDTTMTINKK